MACCCTLLAQAGRSVGLCLTGCRKEACHPGHQHQWVLTELVRSQSSNQSSNMDSISSAGGCLYLYSRYQHITFLLIRISSINMPLLTSIIQFFLGHHRPLLPSISAVYTLHTNLSGPISSTSLLHLTSVLFTFSRTPSCFNSSPHYIIKKMGRGGI